MKCDAFFTAAEAAAAGFPKESIEVPGVGTVFVRVMCSGDRDHYEAMFAKSDLKDFRARLIQATACDESGALLFGPKDIPRLSALPFTILQPLATAAIRINKLTEDAVETERKNSETAPA